MREIWSAQAFSFFTDNSPIREVTAARLAGLGFVGNNGLLISPAYGTYHFIAEIVTDLWLEPSMPMESGCEACRRCLDACPAGALSPAGVDKSRCRSHITQKKGELEDWEWTILEKDSLIFGCDVCQRVCPMNQHLLPTALPEFREDRIITVSKAELEGLSERRFQEIYGDRAFAWRGKKVLLRNLNINGGEE